MKKSFNKKLLSLLLTLVMTISTVPTALAACSHSNWSSWTKLNDAQHQRTCLTSGCTEVEKTNHGWGSTYEKDTSIPSIWQQQNNYINYLTDYLRSKYSFILERKILDVYMDYPIKYEAVRINK